MYINQKPKKPVVNHANNHNFDFDSCFATHHKPILKEQVQYFTMGISLLEYYTAFEQKIIDK